MPTVHNFHMAFFVCGLGVWVSVNIDGSHELFVIVLWKISRCCVICPLAQIQQKDSLWWKTTSSWVVCWALSHLGIFMGATVGRIAISPNPTFLQVLIISFPLSLLFMHNPTYRDSKQKCLLLGLRVPGFDPYQDFEWWLLREIEGFS